MKKVLSTKTLQPDVLAYAKTHNLDVECVDFITITPAPFDLEDTGPEKFDAVAFTSANAVKFFFEHKKALAIINSRQVFALKGKTQDELLARGVKTANTASSAAELADIIVDAKSVHRVLHICGSLKLPVLGERLKASAIGYTDIEAYKTTAAKKKVNGVFDAILFYSPSGVESFLAENDFSNQTICCCIGLTTAQAIKERKKGANIIIPSHPSPTAMLKAVSDYSDGK